MVALPWLLQVVGNSVGADQSRPHATTVKRALVWVWAHKCSTDSLVQSTEHRANGSQTGLSACNALQESGHQLPTVSTRKCCSLNCTHGCSSRTCDFLDGKPRFLFFCNR